MVKKMKKNSILGALAGRILPFFTRSVKVDAETLRRADFTASMQKVGLSFSEKIRDVFRCKWLKKK